MASVLLVEDDPVSAEFVVAALSGHRVTVAASCRQALAAPVSDFQLWLIDGQLPDGCGSELLAQLRRRAPTPAVALTAELDDQRRQALREAGFLSCIGKPISAAELRSALQRWLPDSAAAVWDESMAERALGSRPQVIAQLRTLLLGDLPQQRDSIVEACRQGDEARLRRELHRLRAACGFCGAAELQGCLDSLAVAAEPPVLAAFERACARLLESA